MSTKVNLDDVFRNGLEAHEMPFDEGAWASMQTLMAEDAVRPRFWIPFISKKSINLFIDMTFLTLFVSTLFCLNNTNTANAMNASASTVINSKRISVPTHANQHQSTVTNYASKANTAVVNHVNAAPSNSPAVVASQPTAVADQTPPVQVKKLATELEFKSNPIKTVTVVAVGSTLDNVGLKPLFQRLADEENEAAASTTVAMDGGSHYDCPTIGIHFNYVNPLKDYANSGQMPGMGFDIEGYTHNLLPFSGVGLFFGGSGSIAWMGKSPKTEITLNTPNNDPGKTYLQSNLADLNLHGKLEFGKGNLKFYANFIGGLNFHFISQTIESNKPVTGFENSTDNVWSKASWQWGGGAGVRYHFYPGISLDIRGTYHDVDFMKIANVKQASYNLNSGRYTLNYNTLEPRNFSIKIGFLFCINTSTCNESSTMGGTMNMPQSNTPSKNRTRVNVGVPKSSSTPHQIKVAPKVKN